MKYTIVFTNNFKKDLRKCISRGRDVSILEEVVDLLAQTGTLPSKYKPHKLTGNYKGHWECHLQPDWLLVWRQNDKELPHPNALPKRQPPKNPLPNASGSFVAWYNFVPLQV